MEMKFSEKKVKDLIVKYHKEKKIFVDPKVDITILTEQQSSSVYAVVSNKMVSGGEESVVLDKDDIYEIIESELKDMGYDIKSFSFNTGLRETGAHSASEQSEKTPYFDGITVGVEQTSVRTM